MNIEQQVLSLPIAQRLKELGVAQESYFAWYSLQGSMDWLLSQRWKEMKSNCVEIAAYTSDDLIELLGQNLSVLSPSPSGGYVAMAWPWDNMSAEADTPADALGLLVEMVKGERK